MLRSIFGTPSDLTHSGLRLVQALMSAAVGPYQWIGAGTAEDLTAAWTKRQHSMGVVREHCTSALVLKAGRGRVFDDVDLAAKIYESL